MSNLSVLEVWLTVPGLATLGMIRLAGPDLEAGSGPQAGATCAEPCVAASLAAPHLAAHKELR